jgi:exopolyphosphatase/guanosine-5'-triphosphate,3'-diphosphate pyrophosphatase
MNMGYQTLAAIDLGSNSFKLQVARVQGEQLYLLDALKEPVRLAAGLDKNKRLDADSQQRALDCLKRFNERLRGLPEEAVRCVGTSALRVAKNADQFLEQAEQVLGFPIEIIAGREEARLIYLGVTHSLPSSSGRRLVVDIGGGSTECIIGSGIKQQNRESLLMGCVNFSIRFFPGGKIEKSAMKEAELEARLIAQGIEADFNQGNWDEAVGSSGSIRAIADIVEENGWSKGITIDGLAQLREAMIKAGHVDKLMLTGLRADRRPVLAGGFAILSGIFAELGIKQMNPAAGALREGILYDLLGRISDHDMREETVAEFSRRYHVDEKQAERVEKLAMRLFKGMAPGDKSEKEEARRFLSWAARLHEVGISIAHSGYHKHGAYILENADMPGFSRTDQIHLASLVRAQRGAVAKSPQFLANEASQVSETDRLLVWLLRQSVILCRNRAEPQLPEVAAEATSKGYRLHIPQAWLEGNSLTQLAFEEEAAYWNAIGVRVQYA